MKLSEKEIKEIIKENPFNSLFDICICCDGVEEYGQMSELNETDFDLICDDCKGAK